MRINSLGNVGIGTTTPGTKLTVSGLTSSSGTDLVADSSGNFFLKSSSARFKKNIVDYSVDFKNILNVRPVKFQYIATGVSDIGFIAEEFEKLGLTDLLNYDKNGRPFSIKYHEISLYLIEVIKDHQKKIETLEKEIEEIRARLN